MKEKSEVIFWQDSANLQKLQSNVSRVLPLVQGIVSEFEKIKVKINSINEITGLLDDSSFRKLITEKLEGLVFDRIYPDTPAGFNREKFRQFAEMPDLTELIESFEPLKDYQDGPHWTNVIYWPVYTLIGGKVEVDPVMLNQVSKNYVETIETPQEAKRLEAVLLLCKQLDALNDLSAPGEFAGELSIVGVTMYNDELNKFEPAISFVKTGMVRQKLFLNTSKPEQSLKSQPV